MNKHTDRKNQAYTPYLTPHFMWLLAMAYAILQFFTQLSTGQMAFALMESFHADATQLSYLSSSFFYTFLLMQLPAGLLLDRYGRRQVLTVAAFAFGLGTYLFAISKTSELAVLSRLVMGFGSSFGFIGMLSVTAIWFKPERFAWMVGISELIVMTMIAMVQLFLPHWITYFGWRSLMTGCAIAAFLLAGLLFAFLRDPQQTYAIKSQQRQVPDRTVSFLSGLTYVVKNPQAWLIGASSGFMFSVLTVFCALWGVPFLVNVHQLPFHQASYADALLVFGLGIGACATGYMATRFRTLKPVMYGCLIVLISVYTTILWAPHLPLFWVYLYMFLLGLFAGCYVLYFELCRKISEPRHLNTMIAFINMLTMSGSILVQPTIGWLLDLTHDGTIENSIPVYSPLGYQSSLSVLVICIALSIFFLSLIKEKEKISAKSQTEPNTVYT